MKISLGAAPDEKEVDLSTVKPGEVFRFASQSAATAATESAFYMRANTGKTDAIRVSVIGLADGLLLERDGIHKVVVHESRLMVI